MIPFRNKIHHDSIKSDLTEIKMYLKEEYLHVKINSKFLEVLYDDQHKIEYS